MDSRVVGGEPLESIVRTLFTKNTYILVTRPSFSISA